MRPSSEKRTATKVPTVGWSDDGHFSKLIISTLVIDRRNARQMADHLFSNLFQECITLFSWGGIDPHQPWSFDMPHGHPSQ